MFANLKELQVALRSLPILEEALAALRHELAAANPDLLAVTAPTYVQRIHALQAEVVEYLSAHPTDVSRLAAALPTRLP